MTARVCFVRPIAGVRFVSFRKTPASHPDARLPLSGAPVRLVSTGRVVTFARTAMEADVPEVQTDVPEVETDNEFDRDEFDRDEFDESAAEYEQLWDDVLDSVDFDISFWDWDVILSEEDEWDLV